MHGTCKDKTFSGDASSFAKAMEDREAAEGESRDEAADEGRC